MLNIYDRLSESNKGLVLVAIGVILLLNTFGIAWLNTFILIGAAYLILLGLYKLNAYDKLKSLWTKKQ